MFEKMNNKLVFLVLICVLVSCNTSKKIVYMQDADPNLKDSIAVYQGIVIQPKDILSIVVSSKEPSAAMVYNLPMSTYQTGSTNVASYSQRLLGYTVDMEGEIDFPAFGKLKVEGLTRDQLTTMIKKKLVDDDIIRDAIVTIEFMNFKISVLGEVSAPGTYNIETDRITILEALGRARDLNIYGRRDNILVTREQNGIITRYRVDLRSTDFINSPAYYLQQNDVVYVSPNNTFAARSNINENKSAHVYISIASFIFGLTTTVLTIVKSL